VAEVIAAGSATRAASLTLGRPVPILPRSLHRAFLRFFLPEEERSFRMIPCVRWVSGAVASMLTIASVCVADGPSYELGRGSIGGSIGGSSFRVDRMLGQSWAGDYSEGAQPRFAFAMQFRYVVKPWLRWQVSPGFTWTGYKESTPAPVTDIRFPEDRTKENYLTLLMPVSAQVQYVFQSGWWLYHVGAGPGIYRVIVENRRKVLKDPVTHKNHRGLYPGASGEIGVERFLKALPSTSIEVTVGGHVAFARRDDQFVSGINDQVLAIEARAGVNYYFKLGGQQSSTEATPLPEP
jgi:hypothetical protein